MLYSTNFGNVLSGESLPRAILMSDEVWLYIPTFIHLLLSTCIEDSAIRPALCLPLQDRHVTRFRA